MKLPSMIKGWFNSSTSPEVLLNQYAITGKQIYLDELIEQFNQSLFHYLLTQSDRETAEDILQTTWLKVMTKASLFKEGHQAKSWLFSIARNSLIDELRKQQKWQWQELVDEQHCSGLSLTDEMTKQDQLTQFNCAVEQLPFLQREAFVLQQEGFSLFDIADVTGENNETVKSRLRYARNNIKSYLEANL